MKMKMTFVALAFLLVAPAAFGDAAELYKKSCASCHGADGAGKTKMGEKLKAKDYTDAKVQASFTDAEALKVIIEGKGKMPKGKMTEAEAKDLVKLVRGFKK